MQMTDQSLRDRISLLVDAEIKGGATVILDIPLRVVKVIPQYCTAHPLLRTISHVIRARIKKWRLFLYLDPAIEANRLRKRAW